MADSSQQFKIEIVSVADNAGFKSSSQASQQLKVDTSDLSDETKRQLGMLPPLAEAQGKVVEEVEHETLSRREQRKVLTEVGNAAGLTGSALGELAYGPVGAALALTAVYESLKKGVEAVETAAEELDKEDLAEHQEAIKNVQTAWDDAKTEWAKYSAAVNNAGGGEDPVKKQIADIKAVTDARIEASKRYQEELGRQEIQYLRAHGASPAAIAAAEARQRNALDALDAQKRNADGTAMDQQELTLRKNAQPGLDRAASVADAALAAARARELETQNQLNDATAKLNPNTKTGAELAAKREAANSALGDAHQQSDFIEVPGGQTIDNRQQKARDIAAAQEQLAEVNAEIERTKKAQAVATEQHDRAVAAAAEAEEKARNTDQLGRENAKRTATLPGKIQTDQTVQSIDNEGVQGAAILASIAQGTHETVGQLLLETGKTQQQIKNLLHELVTGHADLSTVVAQLRSQLAQAHAQIHAYPVSTN